VATLPLSQRSSSKPNNAQDAPDETKEKDSEDANDPSLVDLLNETKILLPGTEVFLAFLMTMPFTERFRVLDGLQRGIYLATFFTTIVALICFMLPAAYHRIARPIRHKVRFKAFASRFLVAGLVPLSAAIVLVTWLVTSMVERTLAIGGAIGMAIAILVVWWAIPLLRAHDHCSHD